MTAPALPRAIEPFGVEIPAAIPRDVIVLPREIDDTGVALYHDSAIDLVKALRVEGLNASFAHGSDKQGWIGERSVLQYTLDIVVGMLSAGAYEGMMALLRRRHNESPVRLRITRQVTSESGSGWEWIEVEGTGDAVAQALAQLSPRSDTPPLSD